jgi:hypothetical protein
MSTSPRELEGVNRQMLSCHEAGHVIVIHLARALEIEEVFWMEVDGKPACATRPASFGSDLQALVVLLAGHSAESLAFGAPFELMATRLAEYEQSDWRRALDVAERVLPEQERVNTAGTLRMLGEAIMGIFKHERIWPVLVDLADAITVERGSLSREAIHAIIDTPLSFYTSPPTPTPHTMVSDYLRALLAPLET